MTILDRLLQGDIKKGLFGSFIIKVINILAVYFLSIFLARTLGPDGYGIYSFTIAFLVILALPAEMGLACIVVREIASYEAEQKWSFLKGIIKKISRLVLLIGFIIALLVSVLLLFINDSIEPKQYYCLLIGLLCLPVMASGSIRAAILRGFRKPVLGQIPEKIIRPLSLLFLTIFFFFVNKFTYDPVLVVILFTLSIYFSYFFGEILLRNTIPDKVRNATPQYEMKKWTAGIIPLTYLVGADVVFQQTDIVMIRLLMFAEDVGQYRVAIQISSFSVIFLGILTSVLAPHFTRNYTKEKVNKLTHLIKKSIIISIGASIIIGITILVFKKDIVEILFGEDYLPSINALTILIVCQVFKSYIGICAVLLNMTKHEKLTAKVISIGLITNLLLNYLLIPVFGLEGAAMSTTFSTIIVTVGMMVYSKKVITFIRTPGYL